MEKNNPWGKEQGLHYCSPAHGGWGVVRVAMLVPEIQVLFVCPSGCGRHGALGAIETGHKKQVAYLCIDETDIVSGRYESMVPQAVDELISRADHKPKAVFIFVSCLDDLLGTDYGEMLENLSKLHHIPFRICHMNPISLDSRLPPPITIQKSIYSLLEASEIKSNSINLIGAYVPIDKTSELYNFLMDAGIQKINHISGFDSYEAFQTMSEAKLNLVTRPEGLPAAGDMKAKLGIPFCFAPVSYNISSIALQYRKLSVITGSRYDLSTHIKTALDKIEEMKPLLGNIPISLDAGAVCRPFDMAQALISYGFNVTDIYADKVPEFEVTALDWLQKSAPGLKYHLTEHHTWVKERSEKDINRLSIGFNSGYLTGSSKTVAFAFDEGMFGYGGIVSLMDMLAEACRNSADLRASIENYGLVV